MDPIREVKIRADILHRKLCEQEPSALERLRRFPEFRSSSRERLGQVGPTIRYRQCLALVSLELGFSGWYHANAVLSGDHEVADFGTLLYPRRCCGHLNLWYRRYRDAVVGRRASGGYLLAYRRDFFVADRSFIVGLGLDPDGAEWQQLGFDWARPNDMGARRRLYGALLVQLPREGE